MRLRHTHCPIQFSPVASRRRRRRRGRRRCRCRRSLKEQKGRRRRRQYGDNVSMPYT